MLCQAQLLVGTFSCKPWHTHTHTHAHPSPHVQKTVKSRSRHVRAPTPMVASRPDSEGWLESASKVFHLFYVISRVLCCCCECLQPCMVCQDAAAAVWGCHCWTHRVINVACRGRASSCRLAGGERGSCPRSLGDVSACGFHACNFANALTGTAVISVNALCTPGCV